MATGSDLPLEPENHLETPPPLPPEIEDGEVILRALKTPAHFDVKKSKLKHSAYRPPPGKTILSVARGMAGPDECRRNVKMHDLKKQYIGFGAIYAHSIRGAGSSVDDAPEDYYSHAHIEHPVPAPIPDEPHFAEINEVYLPRLKQMAERTALYLDPDTDDEKWQGPAPLTPP